MKILVVALVALVAAVVAGHYVAADPGFIVIGYGGKVIRTSFAVFMAAVFVACSSDWDCCFVAGCQH